MDGVEPQETVILLAEDEPVIRNLVATMLKREKYVVLTANDGAEALELLDAFTHDIHLLLTDIEMPRVNGWELAAQARRKRPGLKVIAMSGYTIDRIRAGNVPPDAFLRKPFVPPTLLKCVQQVLAAEGRVECQE